MMLSNIIREANTEHEVCFWLTAYIEAIQFGDQLNCLSEHLTSLPLTGPDDVRQRSAKLVAELDLASRRLDDKVCIVIKEALEIFGTALTRLESFERVSQSRCPAPQTTAWPDRAARDAEASSIEILNGDGMIADLRF